MKEIWKPIPGYENYEASNLGRIKMLAHKYLVQIEEKILTPLPPSKRHPKRCFVAVPKGPISVGTLVLKAFRGLPKPGQQCRHLDDNQWNNKISNLKWGTAKENIADMFRNGIRGTKFSKKLIIKISRAKGTHREIADRFDVSPTTVFAVKARIGIYGRILTQNQEVVL